MLQNQPPRRSRDGRGIQRGQLLSISIEDDSVREVIDAVLVKVPGRVEGKVRGDHVARVGGVVACCSGGGGLEDQIHGIAVVARVEIFV